MTRRLALLPLGFLGALILGTSCNNGDGEESSPDYAGEACASIDECYDEVEPGALRGDPICLDRVEGGYCTHHCTADTDCCGVEGECLGNRAEVCGPFESTGEMYCFLSCEDDDLKKTTLTDADLYCQTYASAAFHCRSTGGGSKNRKVCLP